MAAHRKRRPRSAGGTRARTAATLALAGAATATGFEGTGYAEPELSPAQVRAKVDQLYREAEAATEKYNGAKEKADRARARLERLRDEAARRTDRLNSARDALGSFAAAQYRDGGVAPAMQLALSSDPDRYLDGLAFAERAGDRQAASVTRVRRELREIERLRGAAKLELSTLASRQAELDRQKRTVTAKLEQARRLLERLPDHTRAGSAPHSSRTDPGARRTLTADSGSRGGSPPPSPADSPSAAPGSSSGAVSAPGSRAAAAIAYARSKIGSPYVWGATGPDAFDCSGLVQAAYRSAGVSLPRTTYAQIGAGRRVSRSQLQPGDLVFFYSGISHVGLYIGNGQMIHAPNPSAPVRIAPISQMPFAGATRVV